MLKSNKIGILCFWRFVLKNKREILKPNPSLRGGTTKQSHGYLHILRDCRTPSSLAMTWQFLTLLHCPSTSKIGKKTKMECWKEFPYSTLHNFLTQFLLPNKCPVFFRNKKCIAWLNIECLQKYIHIKWWDVYPCIARTVHIFF